MSLTENIEASGALVRDAGAANKGDLLELIAELLNEHCPDIVAEKAYGGIDIFQADMKSEDDAYEYSRVVVKSGFENIRYGTTYGERS